MYYAVAIATLMTMALVKQVEAAIQEVEGIESIFAFAGEGGLNQNNGGAQAPLDAIGQVQIELAPWDQRRKGNVILAEIRGRIANMPGITRGHCRFPSTAPCSA